MKLLVVTEKGSDFRLRDRLELENGPVIGCP